MKLDKLYELREGFFASIASAAQAAPKYADEPTVAVPVWMITQAINTLTEAIQDLKGEDSDGFPKTD